MGAIFSKSKNHDKIIILIGPSGCGKGEFIRCLVPEDKKKLVPVNHRLKHIVDPIRSFKMEDNIILVDTPGFEDNSADSVLKQVVKWMKKNHPKAKVAGILCLFNVTSSRFTQPPTHLLKALCGDKANAAKQVCLVFTHWDKIKSHAEGEAKEKRVVELSWASLAAEGARLERFNKTEEAARRILKRLLYTT